MDLEDKNLTKQICSKEEYKKKIDKDAQERILLILGIIEKSFDRLSHIHNPEIRYTVLVSELCLLLDTCLSALEMENIHLGDKVQERMNACSNQVQTELKSLLDWIQSPTLSPNHPYGNKEMKTAEKDFDQMKRKSKKKKRKNRKKIISN